MSYGLAQRAVMEALTCLRRGARPETDWIDTSALNDPEPRYTPGAALCPIPGCVDNRGRRDVPLRRCRICGRPPGDVHSGECGEMVLAKVVDPHLVAAEDCRPQVPG